MTDDEIKAKLEFAASKVLKETDIELSAFILEKMILNHYFPKYARISVLQRATLQILNFINNSRIEKIGDKRDLDYAEENIKLKEKIKLLQRKENILNKLTDELKEQRFIFKYLINESSNVIVNKSLLNHTNEILDIIEGRKI